MEGCLHTYETTKTGMGADTLFISSAIIVGDPTYMLRPEVAESLFILWRLTKKHRYRDAGWAIFESIETFCGVPKGGFLLE